MGTDMDLARQMAKTDPPMFLEAMAEGAFGKARRMRTDDLVMQGRMRDHLEKLRRYALRIRNGEEVASSVVKRLKLESAGMSRSADERALRTIVKVLEEELGL
jgi:hypothetical protein